MRTRLNEMGAWLKVGGARVEGRAGSDKRPALDLGFGRAVARKRIF